MKLLELTAQQTAKINSLPGEFPYENTKKDSPLEGKKYRRFSYGGIVFIVHSEDKFCKLIDTDTLYSVDFQEGLHDGKPALAYAGSLSVGKVKSLALVEATLAAIMAPTFNPMSVDIDHNELV